MGIAAGTDWHKWWVYKDDRKGNWWVSPPARLSRLGWEAIDFPSHAEALAFAVHYQNAQE